MGKKVKEDKKGPPDDVFDPLLVESRQVGTVVLMLSSPEEDVLSKACEAIYRFSEKCDDNRKVLLDMGGIDPLLRLVQHEDRTVRRNAAMAIGVLSQHHDIRKALKKREETIQCMVTLLAPEEDTVVHEFSALCLSQLALDFSTKVAIFEQEGMEPLIRCLSSSDPDVQKNSIETIALLLQDYQAKAAIRDLNGFPPIFELLKSEYAVIQHLALVALQRASEDAENREVMREQEAINKLIDFIGHPEWNDLHVFAVIVIANCLEDTESVEMIKENGGLMKLVAFIMDTQPPEEEEKGKGGKDKKGAQSRAGKKGKSDDVFRSGGSRLGSRAGQKTAVQWDRGGSRQAHGPSLMGNDKLRKPSVVMELSESRLEASGSRAGRAGSRQGPSRLGPQPLTVPEIIYDDKGKKGFDDSIIPTLPEVKEHASRAIARAAKNADNRKILHEQEVEKMLIMLLGHEDAAVQIAAAQALGVMSENLLSRESIGLWEGIEPIIKMLKNDNPDVREASSMALASLTTSNMNNCQEIMRLKGVEPLIDMLSDARELAIANAACVLTNMAPDESLRSECVRAGIIQALVNPLKSSNTDVQSKTALATAAFVNDIDTRAQYLEAGGVEPLVALLNSLNDDARRSGSWAISIISVDEAIAADVCKNGGLEVLQEIQMSGTRQNAFSKLALERLLDCNLSAKYALSGYLGPSNMIADEFFDVGQLRPDGKFETLEFYCKQEVNQRRPIILINAKPEPESSKPSTPIPQSSEGDVADKSSKSSVTGRSSSMGRTSKGKTRASREREEKQKEEQAAPKEEVEDVFLAPGDQNLIKYIEEVKDRIQPLPTTRDQVLALAQYVAEKMGGPIDRGQVANFSWELPISQLKYDLKSNVIPIGMIKAGIHYHRALLFKTLCDRIAVNCSLIRGEYNRSWNEVLLTADEDVNPNARKYPPQKYLVDLVHQPGRLMPLDSSDAINYQKL